MKILDEHAQEITTNEIISAPANESLNEMATFSNASMLKITREEQTLLTAPAPIDEVEIRPDGFIYWPQIFIRQRLNTVIGVGQWALIPKSINEEKISDKKSRINLTGCLYIRGFFVAMAIGEQIYFTDNDNQSYAKATEAAKSDAIVRGSKDLGIAPEIWQPSFMRKFQREHAVRVYVKDDKGRSSVAWRRKDAPPFWNETGLVPTNQNVKEQEKKIDNPPVTDVWLNTLKEIKNRAELLALFNQNQQTVNEWPALKAAFKFRETELPKAENKRA